MTTDEALLEKVTYTASLASRPDQIDALLDTVRVITSRKAAAEGFTPEERTTLNGVQAQLEQYLVKQELLRSFTPKTLQLQIEQHLAGGVHRRNVVHLAIVICLPIVVALLLYWLPIAPQNSPQRLQLSVSAAFSLFHIGAVSLFLTVLPAFKTQLRKSFIIFCSGLIGLALTFSLQPMLTALNFITSGGVQILNPTLLLIATIIMYIGMRRYAILVGVKGKLLSPWLIAAMATPIAIASWVLPGTDGGLPEWLFDITVVENGLYGAVALLGCLLLHRLTTHIADIYKPSMQALTFAILLGAITSFYSYGIRLAIGITPPGALAIIGGVLIALMGIFLARAGYLFNKVSYY